MCEYGGQKEQQESDEGRWMNVSNIYVTYRFRRLVVCKQVGRLANSKRRRRWMESVEGGNGLLCWYILSMNRGRPKYCKLVLLAAC